MPRVTKARHVYIGADSEPLPESAECGYPCLVLTIDNREAYISHEQKLLGIGLPAVSLDSGFENEFCYLVPADLADGREEFLARGATDHPLIVSLTRRFLATLSDGVFSPGLLFDAAATDGSRRAQPAYEHFLLADRLQQQFTSCHELTDAVWSWPAPLKVIDCVLSLNRRYDSFVFPRVDGFRARHPELGMLHDLLVLIRAHGSPAAFLDSELQYKDAARAETLVGVLEYLLAVQHDHPGGREEVRLEAWARSAHPGDYLAAGIEGFGLAGFQYLRMLFRAETTKPDVHVVRFVSQSLGRSVSAAQAPYLLERAAPLLGFPLRNLDVAIWERGARS